MTNSVRLEVPGCVTEPVIASGCCAVMAEDLGKEELMAVPGVHQVAVDQDRGLLTVSTLSNDSARTEACAIGAARA
ncbi:MAG: hypothetical protein HY704_05955 [Gemmatimonadetes bacterium]|nr:hypothetical protein [Gemmatimonadota bacterium]